MGVLNFFQKLVHFLGIRFFIPCYCLFLCRYLHSFTYSPMQIGMVAKYVMALNIFSNASSSCLLVHMLGILKYFVS